MFQKVEAGGAVLGAPYTQRLLLLQGSEGGSLFFFYMPTL